MTKHRVRTNISRGRNATSAQLLRAVVTLGLVAVAAAVLVPLAAAGHQPKCLVLNARSDNSYSSLQAGVDAAATQAGDTLKVKGTCVGDTTIGTNLTIAGQSNRAYGPATLDGGNSENNQGTVVSIDEGATVAINNITITGGYADFSGGGILNEGTVTLTNSTLSNNTATFSGGGIYNGDEAMITGSTITGNTAGSGGGGGGIFSGGNGLTITRSIIGDNNAEFAGGIFVLDGPATLDHTTVSDNNASINGGGIGIFSNSGTVTLLNGSTVNDNTAQDNGGGIFTLAGTLTIENSTVGDNTAGGNGGGVFNNGAGTVTLVAASTVNGNTAGGSGGGISNLGTLVNCVVGVNVLNNTPDDVVFL
jgi:predicted outer membrane repeat protein